MRANSVWVEKINIPENGDNCVYDICFSPDGSQMLVASGIRILLVNSLDGTIEQALKGHKSNVYCVSYSHDGKRFASGGADKTVVIWTDTLQGSLKYMHGESIQCLAYNPQSPILASCSVNDFGIWSPDRKNVDKHKVPARINACSWTTDGIYLALGLNNGTVSIRTKNGSETSRIERPGGSFSAVWGVAWGKSPEGDEDMLCVVDWGQVLSFYTSNGKQIMKDRTLGFDPVRVVYAHTHKDCEYIIVSGANKACTIFTQEGVKVTSLAEQDSWLWACAVKPKSQNMMIGTQGGIMAAYDIQLQVVHALYKSLYAYRMNMTDVMVQNLLKDLRVRIKCREVVKKLAIFRESMAIQFSDKVLIYQKDPKSDEFKYYLNNKINHSFECSLLVMCSENLILCQDRKLQSYSFNGVKQREWILESHIRYIRSVGGMAKKEVLVAGLKNGQVVKIFLDNPFPVNMVKVPQSVRCVDLNLLHTKIAVVDESSTLFVYDLSTKDLLFQEPSAVSVFWNTYCDDLVSFSGFGVLNIKASTFPIYQQKMAGFVVGFCGHKVFSMQNSSVATLEVPLSAAMYQYIQNNMFKEAYRVASLGVPLNDWNALGFAALSGSDFFTARRAFSKTKNIQFLRLLEMYQDKVNTEKGKKNFLAEVYAHQGRYHDAAKLFKENGESQKAVQMYGDLRMFDLAQEYLPEGESTDKLQLLKQKAEWAAKINEPRAAAEMYMIAGEKIKAIDIMGENGWKDMLLDVGKRLESSDDDALTLCASYLCKMKEISSAAEMFRRVGRTENVLNLYIQAENWEEVFLIAEKHPNLKKEAYLPYAQWLAENDRFAEAQKAFYKAGCPEEAFSVLEQLIQNAIFETRFHDAGYYHWILSMQYLDLAKTSSEEENPHLETYYLHQRKASMYYAYNCIFRYTDQPFTPYMPDALFNISKFLMHELMVESDISISKFNILYTLAKQARTLKAFKLARNVLERLKTVRVPSSLQVGVQLLMLSSKGDPFTDNEELLPMCYRCSTTNPLLNPRGNYCINCYHPFIFSFVSFEVLPLVEFFIEDGITDKEAFSLIGSGLNDSMKFGRDRRGASSKSTRIGSGNSATGGRSRSRWHETNEDGDVQILKLDDEDDASTFIMNMDEDMEFDPFTARSHHLNRGDKVEYPPVVLGQKALAALHPTEVIIRKYPAPLRYKFYKNLLPEMSISQCSSCYEMFHTDDFVLQVLQKGHCPFCRTAVDTYGNHQSRKNSVADEDEA